MMNTSSLSRLRALAFLQLGLAVGALSYELSGSFSVLDLSLALCMLALSSGVLWTVKKLAQTLTRYTNATERLANGDFEARLFPVVEGGEIGHLALQINRLADLSDAFVREVKHSMEHVTEGKYYRKVLERGLPFSFHLSAAALNNVTRATEEKVGRFYIYTNDFETNVDGVVKELSVESQNLRNAAESMSETAQTTSARSETAGMAVDRAAQNVQNVASAAEELSASIAEISRQVSDSTQQTAAAAHQAKETDKLVRSLSEAAQKVGSVVQLIGEIAGQTNLLALNATIEAARAGEAGKGFAVVAGEVKNLATQTSKATDEIVQQITAIQSATDQAVSAIDAISTRIGQVNDISSSIAEAVHQQEIATQEIAHSIQEVSSGTAQVTNDVGQVSTAAINTKQSATQVLHTSETVATVTHTLQQQVTNFIRVVRETR